MNDLTFEEFIQILQSLEEVAPVFRGFAANAAREPAKIAAYLPAFTKGLRRKADKLSSKGVWLPERLFEPKKPVISLAEAKRIIFHAVEAWRASGAAEGLV